MSHPTSYRTSHKSTHAFPIRLLRLTGALIGIVLLLAWGGLPAQAASITVDGTTCSLADAITAANSDTATGGCTAGSGADTIVLQADVNLAAAYDNGATGLPIVTSQITIEGNGHSIHRESSAPNFRLLHVAESGDLTLNNTTVSGGSTGVGGSGGGIYNGGATTLNNSTISGNRASSGGGGIFNAGIMTINNSTVSGNTATEYAGGIFNRGSDSLWMTNSTVSSNTAPRGGGIYSDGTLTVSHSTLYNNSAAGGDGTNSFEGSGGGLFNYGTLTLNATLVVGNSAEDSGNEIYVQGGTINSDQYNLFGHSGETNAQALAGDGDNAYPVSNNDITATSDGKDPTAQENIIDTTLKSNGGPTQTHALVSDSPAIDAAPNCVDSHESTLATDQRGVSRPQDTACDIGAYEELHLLSLSAEQDQNNLEQVNVDVELNLRGLSFASTGFVLTEDNDCFSVVDPATDVTGIPSGFNSSVAAKGDSLEIAIFDDTDPITAELSGTIASITFRKGENCGIEETINFTFGDNPAPSFGDTEGNSVGSTATGIALTVSFNQAPTAIALDPSSIDENQPVGTSVGNLGSTDANSGDTHTYTLVTLKDDDDNDIANDNSSFSIEGSQLKTAAIFDFESNSSYSVGVRTTDNGGLFFEQALTVTIADVAEAESGDCNFDNAVDAGDFSAIALEIFDTDDNRFGGTVDGTFWLNAASGAYPGDPQGCDANASQAIEVGDIIQAITTFFTPETRTRTYAPESNAATLRLDAQNDRAESATRSQPLSLAGNGHAVAAGALHFRYDPARISLDSADADGNGLPDGIQSHLPAGVMAWAKIDAAAGDIQFAFFSLGQPRVVGDGALLHFQWQPLESGDADALASVHIVKASLGDTEGNSIPVDFGQTALKSLYLPTLYR